MLGKKIEPISTFLDGLRLTDDQFFSQVRQGDVVKAKGILQDDGSILAHEVEFEFN